MNATQIIIIVVALLVIKLIQVLMKMKYQKQTPLSAIFGRFAKLAMLFKGSGIKIDETHTSPKKNCANTVLAIFMRTSSRAR